MNDTKNEKIQKKCLDCGNNQTNHTLSSLSNTAAVVTEPLDTILINNFFGRLIGQIIAWLTTPYLFILKSLGLIRWNRDSSKALTARSKVIWLEATARGILMEQLVIFKKPVEFYRATLPSGKNIFFESIPATTRGFVASYAWMDDKSILKKRLAKKNIPTPKGDSAFTWSQAKHLWSKLDHPVIIKPRLGSRGRHTTTYIYTEEDLKKAYDSAKQLCHFIIVEEHLIGSVYRGTCVNGTLIGVLEGMPPRITGNGTDTIMNLITAKNGALGESPIKPVLITPSLSVFLERTGYTLDSVIESGKTIDLSEKIGISYGGGSRELFPLIHPKIKGYLEQAAREVHAGVIGFDFIIEDPSADPDIQKWGIIECNSLPFINLHHDPMEGTPINAAGFVWDAVLKNITSKK